ncbi:hypothetical protein [Streptomyces sp. DH24]|uniref:hypothetical protein n=1 Tax=Streptomyces sp. DH24 TaxID=3040123 RepID=UPI002441FB62|nr:hypothetical protein [Streptomyces sp. DH24]MDG9716525.1 hypothetical protein [Streptomyces sp. DH24]
MTSTTTEGNHPPIYEDLIRELGDAVTAAQEAAARTQHQAAELLGPQRAPHRSGDGQAPRHH